ncbi:MAG TPA: FkbM family methyltransferase [Fimbriiglobus sp.]|nr:FkbM family methyltransferase [Fimbriiglobus sp.]
MYGRESQPPAGPPRMLAEIASRVRRIGRKLRAPFRRDRPPPQSQPPVRYGAYLGDHRYLATTAYGQWMYLDTRDITLTPHVILRGLWEPVVTEVILSHLRPGMRVVEVGSNQGWYTLLMARQVGPTGRVTSFEANKDLVRLVRDSASINGYLYQVALHAVAVGDTSGDATFYVRERYLGNSSLGQIDRPFLDYLHDDQREVTVPKVSLDEFLQGDDCRIDFLKVDAEGAEPLIVRGMERLLRENDRIVIVMEYSPIQMRTAGSDPEGFVTFLHGLGFHVHRIEDTGGLTRMTADDLRSDAHFDILLTRSELGVPDSESRAP